jgi:hypothetical protein
MPENRDYPNLQGRAGTVRELLTQPDNDPAHKMYCLSKVSRAGGRFGNTGGGLGYTASAR